MKSVELRQQRAKLIKDARALLEKADGEKRGLVTEEQEQYDKLFAEINKLQGEIEQREKLEALEAALAEPGDEALRTRPATEVAITGKGRSSEEYRAAFNHWMLGGVEVLSLAERRALQVDVDSAGGYLVTPVQMVQGIIKAMDNLVFVRPLATKYPVTDAESLGAAALTDPADPTWTSELAIGSEDSTMAFGARELHPHPLAKYIKVSRKLLRKVPSVEQLVIDRLSYKFAIAAENAYLNGTGVGQPLGVFTASAQGVSTSRDVSTGNTTTSIQFDGLIEAKYTLKGQYWPRARWLFHRDALKQIAKLQDDDGQYIWRESVRAGEPDMLLGAPLMMSEYAPSTFTTGLYVGVLGDWSNYWIADALNLEMQRLVELYAATNQVGYIGRLETDGMPVLAEAFVRVKLA